MKSIQGILLTSILFSLFNFLDSPIFETKNVGIESSNRVKKIMFKV